MVFGKSATELYHQALDETFAGRLPQALASLDQALKKAPGLVEAWTQRGHVLGMQGEYKQALAAYDRAIELAPADPHAWTGRGTTWEQLGDVRQALADHSRAIQLAPDCDTAYANRGTLQLELGNDEAALHDLRRAWELNPGDAEHVFRMGRYYHEAVEDYAESLEWFQRALELAPDQGWYRFYRGTALRQLGDSQAAISDLDAALREFPEFSRAYVHRGTAYLELGNRAAAFADLTRAIELGDTCGDAEERRAELYLQAGRHAEAARDITLALQRVPDALHLYYMRADIHKAAGRHDLAKNDHAMVEAVVRQRIAELSAGGGQQVLTAIVQANAELWEPGVCGNYAFGVLSFEPTLRADARVLDALAVRLGDMKGSWYEDPELNDVARLVTDERASRYRRRRLPASVTDGLEVWYVDLWIHRMSLPEGRLIRGQRIFSCVAEPGPRGRVELLPTEEPVEAIIVED